MSGIANSDYPYSFFVQNFYFKKLTLILKKTEIITSFQINLVLSPWRSKTTRKRILLIEKYEECLYYYKSRQSYCKLRQSFTNCDSYYKFPQTNYKLFSITNYDKTDVSITNLASSLILSPLSISVPEVSLNGPWKNRGRVYYFPITNHCVLSKEWAPELTKLECV